MTIDEKAQNTEEIQQKGTQQTNYNVSTSPSFISGPTYMSPYKTMKSSETIIPIRTTGEGTMYFNSATNELQATPWFHHKI